MIPPQNFTILGMVVSVRTHLLFLYAQNITEEKQESTG
jgi:uncharacterized membrane protein